MQGTQHRDVVGPSADGESCVEGHQHDSDGRNGIALPVLHRPLGPGQVGEQAQGHQRTPAYPEQHIRFVRSRYRRLATCQQRTHRAEQHTRADDRPPATVRTAVLCLLAFHRHTESVHPGFQEQVAGVLFLALPERFSEGGFVPFGLYVSVEAFETRRICAPRLDVFF